VFTLQRAFEFLKKFEAFTIYMIIGNHDSAYKDRVDVNSLSILGGMNNVHVFNTPTKISIGDSCNAMMCPWGAALDQIENCDVVFGHFEIQTFKMNTYKLCDEGFSIRKILEKSPLIFSGHFHFREERVFEIGKIVYVGNPFQTDLNDAGNQKGFYIFDGNSKEYEFIENNFSPTVQKISLKDVTNSSCEELHDKVRGNIVRFIIDEYLSTDEHSKLLMLLDKLSPRHISVDSTYEASSLIDVDACLYGIDVESILVEFVELMNTNNKQQLQEYLIQTYRAYK
jgi:DNA repair exonuclease SbcCD nuclease subunit